MVITHEQLWVSLGELRRTKGLTINAHSDDQDARTADESANDQVDDQLETIELKNPVAKTDPAEPEEFEITLKSRGVTVSLDAEEPDAPTIVQEPAPRAAAPVKPRQQAASPPAKIPPAGVAPPESQDPFHVRHQKWLIAVCIISAVLLLIAIFFIVKSFTTPESEKIAVSANGIMDPINDDAADADKLTDFRGVARTARIARPKLADLQQRAKEVGGGEERVAIVALLDAQTALLNAYAGMADLRKNNLKPVDNLTDQADNAASDIKAATGQMTAAGRSASVDQASVDSGVDNMTTTLTKDQKLMAAWSRKARSQREKRERFQSQSNGLTAISNEFQTQRNEVGQFYNAPPSQTYSTGGETIDGFESERSSLATRARAADAEQLLRGARGALAHALDMSVRAFPKLRKAWAAQDRTETVAQSSYFPPYDRATNAVDRNWQIFKTKLGAAKAQAARRYRNPSQPNI